jgi:hypothetical protein
MDGLHLSEFDGHSFLIATPHNAFGNNWKVLGVEWDLKLKV